VDGAADEQSKVILQVCVQTPLLASSPPPAPDHPAPVPDTQQFSAPPTWDVSRDEVSAPPGLPPLSRPAFRPPPGLPPPPGLQPGLLQCSYSEALDMSQSETRVALSQHAFSRGALRRCPPPSTAPPTHHAPNMLPIESPVKSKKPPCHPVPLSAPPQLPAPFAAPPSHPAPAMITGKLHGAPPAWTASSPPASSEVDCPDFFLPEAQAKKSQVKLSTEGMKTSMTGLAVRAR